MDISVYVQSLREYGYAVIPGHIKASVLLDLEMKLERIKADELQNPLRDIHFIDKQKSIVSSMHNLSHILPFFNEMMGDTLLTRIVSEYYQDDLSEDVFNSSYFAKPKIHGLATRAHQDNAYFNRNPSEVITCWFGLDDSDAGNGGLYYYRGSDKMGDLPHVANGNLGASMMLSQASLTQCQQKYQKKTLTLKRGDLVLHNCLVVHGSLNNHSNRNRRGINFSFSTERAMVDKLKYERYQEQLGFFLKNKKEDFALV
jgi:hypothetical protein